MTITNIANQISLNFAEQAAKSAENNAKNLRKKADSLENEAKSTRNQANQAEMKSAQINTSLSMQKGFQELPQKLNTIYSNIGESINASTSKNDVGNNIDVYS